jgi:hypothetical protein
LFAYLERRGADFLIAVKHSRRKGCQVIHDRLTYGRKAPLQASRRERKRGRDLTWTLRGMPALDWVVEKKLAGQCDVPGRVLQGDARWQGR